MNSFGSRDIVPFIEFNLVRTIYSPNPAPPKSAVLDVTISEVFHILLQDWQLVFRLGFAIGFQGNYRLLSPGYLFLNGWFPGAILVGVTLENIDYAWHVAIGCAGG